MRIHNFPGLNSSQRKVRSGELQLPLLELCAFDLGECGRRFDRRGWVPATSGNFSVRLDRMAMLITRSGVSKAELTKDDVMRVGLDGKALTTGAGKSSAETPLHTMLYRHDPEARSVLHTHSLTATVLSRCVKDELVFSGYEILKAFPGIEDHEQTVVLPIFDNSQDIEQLATEVQQRLVQDERMSAGFLIRGHGLYAWGDTVESALRHIEAWEFLLEAEVLSRQLAPSIQP